MYKIVSESDIRRVLPKHKFNRFLSDPKEKRRALWILGLNVYKMLEEQSELQHRNSLGEIVTCRRYLSYERTDNAWLESGYASDSAHYFAADQETRKEMRRLMKTRANPDPYGKEEREFRNNLIAETMNKACQEKE